jgi:hypothetical protein
MDDASQPAPFAWQPLTPGGVAAFARATLGRLLLVQFVVALLAGGAVAWFLHREWFPVITEAINKLPPQGQVLSGRLDWHGDSPQMLAESRFLALTVDLNHEGSARSPSPVQVEFGQHDIRVFSLFGFARAAYPRGWPLPFNRPELEPRWGAWRPAILALALGVVVAALLLSWWLLAWLYCWPAWLVGFFANRDLGVKASRRLAGAALLPGAVFLIGAMVLYGLGVLDLIRLTVAAGLHLAVGWLYLALSIPCLPRHPAVAEGKRNPFDKKRGG